MNEVAFIVMMPHRLLLGLLLGLLPAAIAVATLAMAHPAVALDAYINHGPQRLMIGGFDTTAYFRSGGPRRGSGAHAVKWQGVTWRFASAKDAAAFRSNPHGFVPQFGAYCTGGLSQQHAVAGHPRNWRMHAGKLYLFATAEGARRFDRDPAGTIQRARTYWNTLPIRR